MRLLLLFLFLSACNYQDDPLSGIRQAASVETSDFERSFERYLGLFVADNPAEESFDTLVRYKKMFRLSKEPQTSEGAEYRKLVTTISDYFAGLDYDSLNDDEKKANLINAYNFFVMDYMATNYDTVTNILNAPTNVFTSTPFQFANKLVSLDYLEKVLLYRLMTFEEGTKVNEITNLDPSKKIKVFQATKIDARFHFAVICGAKGCPILNTEMYYGTRLNEQLTDITEKGLLLKRNLDQSNETLKLTELFNWYRDDFNNHAETKDSEKVSDYYGFLEQYSSESILRTNPQTIPYDWTRNGIE